MHHFIFPTADSWISSGSDKVTGETMRDQNFGQDEILELKKFFYNESFDHQTRILLNFAGKDLTAISQSVVQGEITSPKYYLRLYEAQGNQELSTEYKLAAFAISQSWDEGSGKFSYKPKVTDGVSFTNRKNKTGASALTWSINNNGDDSDSSSGPTFYSGSWDTSQSFSYESPDVEMDITNMVDMWFGGDDTISNYGLCLRFSGSQETDEQTFGQLKFFSKDTSTIYAPKLEVRWDDHTACSGSNTGSLTPLTMSGQIDNYLYMKHFRNSYKEDEKVKFRFGARKRYIQKDFTTSVQTVTGSFIPESSGSYSILDVATGETIVPFSAYTSMSCDAEGPYFTQWLSGFYPDRIYKILIKLKYDDGQQYIYDDDFEFKVVR